MKKRGGVPSANEARFPGKDRFLNPVFVDQILKSALSFLLARRTVHRMVEQNELKLNSSGLENLGRLRQDLHPIFRGGEAGGQQLGSPLLLNDAEPAGPEGDQPPVMTERRDANAAGSGSLEDRFALFDLDVNSIDSQFYHVTFRPEQPPGTNQASILK